MDELNQDLQARLTEMVSKQAEESREDEILRQAAKIILARNELANPASVDVRFVRHSPPIRVEITVRVYHK